MEIKEYIENDKKYVEVSSASFTVDSYGRFAFVLALASTLVLIAIMLVGLLVSRFGFDVGEVANASWYAVALIGNIISMYLLLLFSYPFYLLISNI